MNYSIKVNKFRKRKFGVQRLLFQWYFEESFKLTDITIREQKWRNICGNARI